MPAADFPREQPPFLLLWDDSVCGQSTDSYMMDGSRYRR